MSVLGNQRGQVADILLEYLDGEALSLAYQDRSLPKGRLSTQGSLCQLVYETLEVAESQGDEQLRKFTLWCVARYPLLGPLSPGSRLQVVELCNPVKESGRRGGRGNAYSSKARMGPGGKVRLGQ